MERIIAFSAEYLFIPVLLLEGLYLAVFHLNRWRTFLVAGMVIGGIGFLVSLIANRIIVDPRPFVAGGFRPLIHSSTDNGFPSDHTLLLATTAAVTAIANRRAGVLALLAAIAVGLARVYCGVHHFADIAGSLVIVGFAMAVFAGLRGMIGRSLAHWKALRKTSAATPQDGNGE
jgi:membrane-associated phospholipid phosphatase